MKNMKLKVLLVLCALLLLSAFIAERKERSLSFINEGRWDVVLSKIHKGDYVFIQFGHNDEKSRVTLHTESGSTFDDNLRRFVNGTCAKGGNPVLFNSIVRRNFPPP